jgi:LysM repeat protein
MDTISRENSSSMLPVGGIIVGAIGLLLGGLALVQVSKVNKAVAEHQVKVDKVDSVEAQATAAASAAEKAKSDVATLQRSTQSAFDSVGPLLSELKASVTKLEESAKKPAVAAASKKGAGGEPAVAGPNEYVIKGGDTGSKIATAHGVTLADLQTVNPGVNWSGLKVGQKIKLPKK